MKQLISPGATREDYMRNGHSVVKQGTQGSAIITVPNGLSVARLVLGACFPWIPFSWRLVVIFVALLTDLLDGWAARFWGACSLSGRMLDPIADKVFVVTVMGTCLAEGKLTVTEVMLVGMRDMIVIVGAAVGLLLRMWPTFSRMAPTLLGKTTTFAQFAFFLFLVDGLQYRSLAFALAEVDRATQCCPRR